MGGSPSVTSRDTRTDVSEKMKRIISAIFGLAALLCANGAVAGSFTACELFSQPTPGDPAVTSAWGGILNLNFALIDTAQAGILNLSVAGSSNVTLTSAAGSPDQARNRHFIFTGALTGNITVFWPLGLCRDFIVTNNTTGAFTLTLAVNNGVGAPDGSTTVAPQGSTIFAYSDGANLNANSASNVAGGDLSGTYPTPTVVSTHLATPLPVAQGGTNASTPTGAQASLGLGSAATQNVGAAAGNVPQLNGLGLLSQSLIPTTLNGQYFSTSGTYTTPATTNSTTVFKFTLTGGGGGGAGGQAAGDAGAGGGAGGTVTFFVSGLSRSQALPFTIGAGGAGGTSAPTGGSVGTASTMTIGATTLTASGGAGGNAGFNPGGTGTLGGLGGAASGGTNNQPGGDGSNGITGLGNASYAGPQGGLGGASFWGGGGRAGNSGNPGTAARACGSGGGGGGPTASTSEAGAAGASGCLQVETVN